jgi:hypothetical protein
LNWIVLTDSIINKIQFYSDARMAHPIVYGEKDLTLTAPRINVYTGDSVGFNITGNITTPTIYGKTVATPEFVTISPTGIMGSEPIPASGVLTLGAVDTNPNANAALITGTQLQLEPASSSFPGVVTASGNQSFGGNKVFNGAISAIAQNNTFGGGQSTVGMNFNATGQVLFASTPTSNVPMAFQTTQLLATASGGSFVTGPNGGAYQDSNLASLITSNTAGAQVVVGNSSPQTSLVLNGTLGASPASPQMMTIGTGGVVGSQAIPATPAAVSFNAVGSTPNANGASVTSNAITLQPASPTQPGVVSTTTQGFLGIKTFSNAIVTSAGIGGTTGILDAAGNNLLSYNQTASPSLLQLGGPNTSQVTIEGVFGVSPSSPQMMTVNSSGVTGSQALPAAVSFNAVGAAPSANGATVASNAITLQPADGTHPGLIATAAQTMGSGVKTFSSAPVMSAGVTLAASQKILNSTGTTLLWSGLNNDFTDTFAGNGSGAATTTTNTGLNVGVGQSTLAAKTAGVRNTALGSNSLSGTLGTGGVGNNTAVGYNAGSGYTGTEQNNICIGSGTLGTAGESNVIRIGTGSTTCFIAGISGVTSAGAATAVINGSGQLGTVISSKKYKQDIMDIDVNPIMEFKAVQYREIVNPTEIQYGFIAEQVLPFLPEAIIWEKEKDKDGKVMYDSQGNILYSKEDPETIQYHKLWPLLQDYVKKLDNRVQSLERQVERLGGAPLKRGRPEDDSNRTPKRARTQ